MTSQIGHEPHKTFVLMILMVAVHQCRTWIVGDEVDFDCAEPSHVYGILDHARGGLFTDLCDLEAVAMHVNGWLSPLLLVIASR
jgi:hypothetical protein